MPFGYHGRILEVDLSSGSMKDRTIEDSDAELFFLGSGLSARILLEETDPDLDPLSPENPLIFMRGLFNGTPVPGSPKICLSAKSPLTGIWGEAAAGGHWSAAFSFTGYDGVIFNGAAEKPVYLLLDDGRAVLNPADHLVGKDTFETEELLKKELGADVEVACIGPAGERGSLIASVMFGGPVARAAGRCGMGTVMGIKNLKAFVVRGEQKVPLYDEAGLKALIKSQVKDIMANAKSLSDFSTAGGVEAVEFWGDLPIKNWYLGSWAEGATKTCGQTFLPTTKVKSYYCYKCPIGCGKIVQVTEGPYAPLYGHGPEYETCAGFGAMCLVDDYEAVIAANEACNRLGLDTISASAVVAFALEAFEQGLLTKDDIGFEAPWGDGMAVLKLTQLIGKVEGIGKLLSQGVKRAAEELGPKAEEFAVHTKGLEYPMHDPRAFVSMGCNYATANRGACHLEALSYFLGRGIPLADLGYTEAPDPHTTEGKARICYEMQNFQGIFNPLGLCKFLFLARVGPAMIAGWIKAATGWDYDCDRVMETGERLFNLKRLYNVRLGCSRKDDVLPPRLFAHARPDGKAAGVLPHLGKMLDEYYAFRGWTEYGIPTRDKLAGLGLDTCGEGII